VVVRTDFAEKYPEVVVAYVKAIIEADAWVRKDPQGAAEKIAGWTGIDKEVVYMFLGPSGIMTVDPTIKAELVRDAGEDAKVLQRLDRMKEFDIGKWVNDSYVRKAFAETGLDYDKQAKSFDNYEVAGTDEFCRKPIAEPRKAGEIWVAGERISAYASAACTLAAYGDLKRKGKKINVTYLFDSARGIKLFADQAFFAVSGEGDKAAIEPFLLKKDAEAAAKKSGGKVVGFPEAVKAVGGA